VEKRQSDFDEAQVAEFLQKPVSGHVPITLGGRVSIGMSAFGNLHTTMLALKSLFASVDGDYELILVDDCSPDEEVRRLFALARQLHKNTKLFFFRQNLEYSGSLNAILSHASGERIIFLSNDVMVTPYYLRELLDMADAATRHGIVRGCSNFVDNQLPTHNIKLNSPLQSLENNFELSRDIFYRDAGKSLADEFLTGDAFLVTRSTLDKVGTFDPLFFGYFADLDYGVRARIAGYDLVLARGAFAWHRRYSNFDYLPEHLRSQKIQSRFMRVYENWARFKMKYGMSVSTPYRSLAEVPWNWLCATKFDSEKHYAPPGDYREYLVP